MLFGRCRRGLRSGPGCNGSLRSPRLNLLLLHTLLALLRRRLLSGPLLLRLRGALLSSGLLRRALLRRRLLCRTLLRRRLGGSLLGGSLCSLCCGLRGRSLGGLLRGLLRRNGGSLLGGELCGEGNGEPDKG